MTEEQKAKHGGKRSGAGRKSVLKDPVKILVTLEKRQMQALVKFCKQTSKGKSEAVRYLIDANTKQEESDNGRKAGLPIEPLPIVA